MALNTNLISYYKLDESSGNAADSVASNTLTNTGTATYVSGKINNGVSETATKYLSNTSNYGITGGDITIAGWVQMGAYVSGSNAFFGQSDSGTFTSYYIERSASNTVLFYREKGGVGSEGYSVTYTFSAATWYHLAITYSSNTITAYINGSSVGTGSASGSGSSSITDTGLTLNGRYYTGGTPINLTTELVDEVGIWSRALTGAEITQLYNAGAGMSYPFPSSSNSLTLLGVS